MNKVITVNLNGRAFQLEENGHDALRAYLDNGARALAGNPDRDEIISDIERAIAEKFCQLLGAYKTVVLTPEVAAVIAEMGPVDNGSEPADQAGSGTPRAEDGDSSRKPKDASDTGGSPPKRLFKLRDGAMFAGVCNGLGAHFNIDATVIRLLFVVLALVTHVAWLVVVYLVLMLIMPRADTAAEKAAAHGAPFTAQEFIRRARAGYYEGMKGFPDRETRREWRRRFKRDLRSWRRTFRWEMRAARWNWQQHWPQPSSIPAGWGWCVAWPFLSLLNAALALVGIAALISLLATGAIFGRMLPAEIPVWAGVILLFIGYQLVVLPLKAARHVFHHHSNGGAVRPFFFLWDAMVWIGFVVVLVWLAAGHSPEVRDAIKSIPPTFHQAVESMRQWWTGR